MVKKQRVKNKTNWLYILLFVVVTLIGVVIVGWSINRPFCANSISCEESLGLKIENQAVGIFNGRSVTPPVITNEDLSKNVLGESDNNDEKHIYVDLGTQTLTAYNGDVLFMEAKISSGKWFDTPTGEFRIWQKLKSTRMSGGEGADYYNLPNVPYVMFFSNDKIAAGRGFGLHGAYWHNNFGHPMSHGCVNMRAIDAEKLYYWVSPETRGNVTAATKDDPGTKITIYGEAPL